jgi:hypothetical protein
MMYAKSPVKVFPLTHGHFHIEGVCCVHCYTKIRILKRTYVSVCMEV